MVLLLFIPSNMDFKIIMLCLSIAFMHLMHRVVYSVFMRNIDRFIVYHCVFVPMPFIGVFIFIHKALIFWFCNLNLSLRVRLIGLFAILFGSLLGCMNI